MKMRARLLGSAGFLLLGAFVFGGLAGPRSAGHGAGAVAQATNQMAVDANASTSEVDANTTELLNVPFDVAIDVTQVLESYNNYQFTLEWDAAKVAFVSATHLSPDGFSICGGFTVSEGRVFGNCAKSDGESGYVGQMDRVTLNCEADGTVLLHLKTTVEDPTFGTTTFNPGGVLIDTRTADATVTCGAGGPGATPPPGPTTVPTLPPAGPTTVPTPPPAGPTATPVPVPAGMESMGLVAGCNPVASTYPDATPIGEIAAAVFPAGILQAMWEFESGVWLGYSPRFPEVSDLRQKDFLDVLFVCVGAPGSFFRPLA